MVRTHTMKRLQMIYLFCCLSIMAWAEGKEFSVLDWSMLRFDSIAPEYRNTVVLNEGGSWVVSVEYPEYRVLKPNLISEKYRELHNFPKRFITCDLC